MPVFGEAGGLSTTAAQAPAQRPYKALPMAKIAQPRGARRATTPRPTPGSTRADRCPRWVRTLDASGLLQVRARQTGPLQHEGLSSVGISSTSAMAEAGAEHKRNQTRPSTAGLLGRTIAKPATPPRDAGRCGPTPASTVRWMAIANSGSEALWLPMVYSIHSRRACPAGSDSTCTFALSRRTPFRTSCTAAQQRKLVHHSFVPRSARGYVDEAARPRDPPRGEPEARLWV